MTQEETIVIPSGRYIQYSPFHPLLMGWRFLFYTDDGVENENLLKTLLIEGFHKNPRVQEMMVPGTVYLHGFIYGSSYFEDGDEIRTSKLEKIKRVECQHDLAELFCGKYHADEIEILRKTAYCATTQSGHEYYFYPECR